MKKETFSCHFKNVLLFRDRDESHYVDKTATVAELTGYLTSWSGFQNFRAKNGDEAAQKILETFQDR